jgi:hypothetical protein
MHEERPLRVGCGLGEQGCNHRRATDSHQACIACPPRSPGVYGILDVHRRIEQGGEPLLGGLAMCIHETDATAGTGLWNRSFLEQSKPRVDETTQSFQMSVRKDERISSSMFHKHNKPHSNRPVASLHKSTSLPRRYICL